jgi:insulysin
VAVYRDAEHIAKLTKEDVLEFVATVISPRSSTRAKSSIHLIAQSDAPKATTVRVSTEVDGSTSAGGACKSRPQFCLIKDVRTFKSIVPLAAIPRVIKPIAEFLENGKQYDLRPQNIAHE